MNIARVREWSVQMTSVAVAAAAIYLHCHPILASPFSLHFDLSRLL